MTGPEIDNDIAAPAEASEPDGGEASGVENLDSDALGIDGESSDPAESDDSEHSADQDAEAETETDPAEPEPAGSDHKELEGQATQLEGDLDGVDAALKRLDDKTYATCESCGETLSDEQLVADPTRRTCVNGCASR